MNPETMARLAESAASGLDSLYEDYLDGVITADEFYLLAVEHLRAAAQVAAGVADLAVVEWLSQNTGAVVPPLGLSAGTDTATLTAALTAALGAAWNPRRKVTTLARDTALKAAQDSLGEALKARGVPGWERIPAPDACQMCRDLSGTVLPITVVPIHHTGCQCGIRPVMITDN